MKGHFALGQCGAPASITGKEGDGGQKQEDETRDAQMVCQAGKGESRMEPEYLRFKNMLSSGKPRSPNFQYTAFCMFLGKEICCSHD